MQSLGSVRTFFSVGLVLAALTALLMPRTTAPTQGSDTPILELHTDSLTTYLHASATNVQDIRPRDGQRGVNLDGSFRAGPSQLMRIAGNPFESAWRTASVNGIRLETGTFGVQDVDIALPAEGFSWVIGRSYNARQETSGSAHRDSDGPQGKNWFQNSQPEILLFEHATDDDKDIVYLVYGADRYAEYKRVDIAEGTSDTFKGTNGAAGVILFEEDESGPDTYTLHDQHSNEIVFFGFDGASSPAEGQLWKITDPADNVAYVGDASSASAAISSGYHDTHDLVEKAYDTSDRRYTYSYSTLDSVLRLTEVEVETKSGGDWDAPTGLETVAKVEYSYYSDESYGDAGDLKMVEITTPLTDSGVEVVMKKYYRYWEGTFNASSNPGHPHALMFVVDFEGTRKQDWEDETFDEDFLTLSNSSLENYASAYFEYDSSHRIDEAWFNGDCGCSGGNNGTHEFEYESNGSFSDTTTAYDTDWKARTVVERPDGTFLTQYLDEAHQGLHRVITNADPDNTSPTPDRWVTSVVRDSNGWVTSVRTPATCTGYTHSSGAVTVSSSVGLVNHFTRDSTSTSVTKGFVTETRWSEGTTTSENHFFDREWEYDSEEISTNLDEAIVRPYVSKEHVYAANESTDTGDRITTEYTVTAHSGTLAWDEIEAKLPTIPTSENGSGSANYRTTYYRADGSASFVKDEGGFISYQKFSDGRATEEIRDVDMTAQGLDYLPVGLSSSGSPVHRKDTSAYDAQGRPDEVTQADGRVLKSYYSKLADGRLVTLKYNDYETSPSTKFYGPVQYTVTNHAGQVEVQATVALTSNESTTALTGHVDETDDDPITGMDLGSVVRLTTNHYNDTGGKLEETRLYHLVPASGEGSDGTNYDPTLFGYNDSGQRWRVKEPTGTIRRTVYNDQGLVASSWIGTNDSTFSGGESSGTDNMIKTEELLYDGDADDGNGYLTKRTLFVEDSATDKRETTYTNDVRGRVVLEAKPTSPHAFHSYDNRGRRDATGLFSSTGSIVVGTDDPASESTNRIGLSQTYYDKLGRVYKRARHKIDDSDGSDDDNLLTETTYDEVGRAIKVDGSQLTKTFYDRLGRTTHRFILGEDNDTTYAHADDVTGDAVLQESQTVYESSTSDDVLMRVRIDRYHSSLGTGALDSNADSDDLKVTAGNLGGRAQITAMWYDRFGRVTDRVQYGTYGETTFDRDGLSVPSRSDTALRTTMSYGTDGVVDDVTDPRDLVTRTEYDAAGRTTKVVRNYDSSVNSGNPSGTDDNVTVKYEYTDGLRTKIIADLPSGQTDQETLYIYGTTEGTPSASDVTSGHLLRAVVYPDSTNTGTTEANINSDDDDVVSYAYNAQGQRLLQKDQAGNVVEFDYDDSGRQTHRRVTTLATGFDGDVRRISTTYNDRGKRELVTQYDNATVGSGSVVDEVKFTYEDWGNVEKFEQDRNSAVGASGSVDDYEVSYSYAKAVAGRNAIRRTDMTMPSGNVIDYDYSSTGQDANASRVTKVKDGAVVLAKYDYLGVGRVVGITYEQPGIFSKQYDSTTTYADFDRFNRVVASRWTTDLATDVDFYDMDVTYDRSSNITLMEDNVHAAFDVEYTMDDADRLERAEQGTWTGSTISPSDRDKEWTLSHTGNWDLVKLDLNDDGDGQDTDEYEDDRTHNDVNELTGRDTDDNGTDDYTLTYDDVGNLTDDGESYEYEYDAFGRMTRIEDRTDDSLVADYEYNGLGHMKSVHQDTDDDGDVDSNDKWFHAAYDERWRMAAYYREDDTDPKEEFINQQAGADGGGSSSYVNGVICRDKDANTAWTAASDGVLEQRYYFCHNWRGDVAVLMHKGRYQVESDRYAAYGEPHCFPEPDTNSDGKRDGSDLTQFDAWINASQYDVRGDTDLDGDVDATDKSLANNYGAATLGWGSATWSGNRKVYAGYEAGAVGSRSAHARQRVVDVELGRWLQRDSLGYLDGPNLFQYTKANPVAFTDPMGSHSLRPGGSGGASGSPGCQGGPVQIPEFVTQGYQECCAAALQFGLGLFDKVRGATICCGKQVVMCTYNAAFQNPNGPPSEGQIAAGAIAKECSWPHEREHARAAECCNKPGDWGEWSLPDGDPVPTFAAADQASEDCAKAARDNDECSNRGLQGNELQVCKDALQDFIDIHPTH